MVDDGHDVVGIERGDSPRLGGHDVVFCVFIQKTGSKTREKNREEKGGVQGVLRRQPGGVWWGHPSFPSFRQTAKWGTTHMFVSFPATSSGVSSTTQRHRAHHICKDPCSNLFFPWGDPSTRQAFPTPPLLDPTSLSPQRKAPGRIAGQDHKSRKGLIRRRERNIWLSKHISHEPKS